MARTRKMDPSFYAAKQVSSSVASLRKFMSSRNFVDGFESVRRGRPFDYSRDLASAWAYERGRLLATIYGGALKNGQRVRDDAIDAYVEARRSGIII